MRKILILATILLVPALLLMGVAQVMAAQSAAHDALSLHAGQRLGAHLAIPKAPAAADLSASVKTVTPTAVYAGGSLAYTIRLSNTGDVTAAVALIDVMPTDTAYVDGSLSATSGAGIYFPPQQTIYWVGNVAPDATVDISFAVVVSDVVPAGATITNTAEFSDSNAIYYRSAAAVVLASPADLSPSTKVVTPTALLAGETVSYTIVLSNSGQTTATTTLVDDIPAYTTYVSGSLTATAGAAVYSATLDAVLWDGDVPLGSPVSIDFAVTVSPTAPGGTLITNTAVFSHDASLYERSAVATVLPFNADLTPSTKSVTPTALFAGENMSYTIVLKNSGNVNAVTILEDFIPNGTTYVDGSLAATSGSAVYNSFQDSIVWNGTVAPGTPVSISFSVETSPTLPGGTVITNTARFEHNGIEYERSAASTIILTPADLSGSQKTVDPTTVVRGNNLDYDIVFFNSGETPAQVAMTDTVPLSTTFVTGSLSASAGTAFYFPPQNTVFWVGDALYNTPVSISFSVETDSTIISGTLITNTADYVWDSTADTLSATALVIEPPPTDLSLSTKTVTPTVPLPGDPVSYTIVLLNTGAETATVYLTDTLPISVTYISGTLMATAGAAVFSDTTGTVYWEGDIASGDAVSITFAATVSWTAPAGSLITNTAYFSDQTMTYQAGATFKVAHLLRWPIMLKFNP